VKVVTGRASGVKWGDYGGGGTINSVGVRPPALSVPLPPLSSPFPQNPEDVHDGMQ